MTKRDADEALCSGREQKRPRDEALASSTPDETRTTPQFDQLTSTREPRSHSPVFTLNDPDNLLLPDIGISPNDTDDQNVPAIPLSSSAFCEESERRENGQECVHYICYGMINRINCQLLPTAKPYNTELLYTSTFEATDRTFVHLNVDHGQNSCLITDQNGCALLQVNTKLADALCTISGNVNIKVYAEHNGLAKALECAPAGRQDKTMIHIYANVYGTSEKSEFVGASLSSREVFLQHPLWQEADIEYRNPHFITFDNISQADIVREKLRSIIMAGSNSSNGDDWNSVLDNLPQVHADRAPMKSFSLTTTLFSHQADALNYMTRRETGSLEHEMRYWSIENNENGVPVHRHVVTATESYEPPVEPQSGILADDMGLGKTRCAISLIASSLDRAAAFARPIAPASLQADGKCQRSKATLVIVPSQLLLEDWGKEITRCIAPGVLRVTRYHGHERARHFSDLLDFDIVLTTFGTVTTELRRSYFRGRQVLFFLKWFRIILDEAHTIRSQRTRQFQAVMDLQAQHYWCLTGTPISNGIKDIGALLKFCRVPLLEDSSCFSNYVSKSTGRSFNQRCKVLRQALAPICLRRTKTILAISQPYCVEYRIQFSDAESKQYHQLLLQSGRLIDQAVSCQNERATRHTMLQVILRLRIFCNQGTYMPLHEDNAEEHFDPDEALALLEEKNESYCSACSGEVKMINQMSDAGSGVLGCCSHLLCGSCFEVAKEDQSSGAEYMCPVCKTSVSQQSLAPRSGSQSANVSTSPVTEQAIGAHSSKLERLTTDLLQYQGREKSIVFSTWTKTLDLASGMCLKAGIQHVRVDGRVPQFERSKALERFKADPEISTLLMTFGTGALGLNLPAATRIHILEPQWNPSVEDQAIGRAVRIGQAQDVTVVRYLVEKSVEQNVRSRQNIKQGLAAGAFGDALKQPVIEDRISAATLLKDSANLMRDSLSVSAEANAV